MLDATIISALLKSREAYEDFKRYGETSDFGPIASAVYGALDVYYSSDEGAGSCDPDLLSERIGLAMPNPKHSEAARSFIGECVRDVSVVNFRSALRDFQRRKIGDRLSLALANGSEPKEVEKLIGEYQGVGALGAESSDANELLDVFDTSDLTEEGEKLDFIRLFPKQLNDHLDGGALPGHHVVVFARPESGKTAFCVNLTYGFLKQGLGVLYVANEEPGADIRDRIRGRALSISRSAVRAGGEEVAGRLGGLFEQGRISICESTSFGTVRSILNGSPESYSVVVIDQIRNMRLKSDSRTAELEAAGIEARAIAKEYGVLVVSVTQAGDSASNKVFLDMSDIDSSKTGIPASADLLIGLGADAGMKANGLLGISLSKNKLSGDHWQGTVSVNFSTGEIT